MGVKAEVLEWLGLKPADMVVALAAVAGLEMLYVTDQATATALAIAAIGLALAACPLGMRHDPEVSAFTNGMKLAAYPLCVLLALGAAAYRFGWL
jgi:hypothetical protein